MKMLNLSLTCAALCSLTTQALADKTFLWAGNDSRFSASFSISDAAFAVGEFHSPTAVDFEFHDPADPTLDIILNNPLGAYPNNFDGSLTSDKQSLSHDTSPSNPNISFWVAVWKVGGIDVGMYSWNSAGSPAENFQYVDYNRGGTIATTTGSWTLEADTVSAPESMPLGFTTAVLAGCVGASRFLRRERS